MKTSTLLVIGALSAVTLSITQPASASHCKGLEQPACSPDKACRWMPERKAGETKKANGEAHVRSAKAHCRLDIRKAGEIAAKQ